MRALRSWLGLLGTLALAGLPAPAGAQPVGSEFQINTYTTGSSESAPTAVAWSQRTRAGTSSSSGQSYGQDGSDYGDLRPALRQRGRGPGQRVPRQLLHDRDPERSLPSPRTRTGTSSSSGTAWPGRQQPTGSSASATTARACARGASSASTRTRRRAQSVPSVASDASGNFVVVWEQRPGRRQLRDLRPALRQRAASLGRRVPRQLVHDVVPAAPVRGLGRERELRRRLGRAVPGRRTLRDLRPALRQRGRAPGSRVPRQLLHDGQPVRPLRRLRRERELRRRLGSYGQDGSSYGIFGQRYDSAGVRSGGRVPRELVHDSYQRHPSVASDASGNFVVVWQSYRPGRQRLRGLRPALRQRRRALRGPSSRSTPTRRLQDFPLWRLRVPTSSSWPGSPTDRTEAATVSSASASTLRETIMVVSPNTNVKWRIGSLQRIQWTHNLGADATFRIELDRDDDGTTRS